MIAFSSENMNGFRMAWRNLWRNKRRTLITAASVFFAVFFALVMRSFQLGAYERLFTNVIESYSGYLQLQREDYLDDPVPDNGFLMDSAIFSGILKDPNVTTLVPRIESFALAASGSRTQGVIVMGIDPEGEDHLSGIRKKLVRYKLTPGAIGHIKGDPQSARIRNLLETFINESYTGTGRLMQDLSISKRDSSVLLPLIRRYAAFDNDYFGPADRRCILISSGLSDYLQTGIGDTLVLMGQGYQGSTAAGKYKVHGIVKLPSPEIDNRMVYLPLEDARELLGAPGLVTSAVVGIDDNDDKSMKATAFRLGNGLPGEHKIRTWHELNALLVNQMEADNRSGAIMIGILYLVIAFGVFGTMLMMLAERRREFGMLLSIGMQKGKLAGILAIEMGMTGFLGIISGIIASLPIVVIGNIHPVRFTGMMARMYEDWGFEPVMPTLLPDMYYLWQILVVLIILSVAIGYSVRRIFRINVINALRA